MRLLQVPNVFTLNTFARSKVRARHQEHEGRCGYACTVPAGAVSKFGWYTCSITRSRKWERVGMCCCYHVERPRIYFPHLDAGAI